MINEKLRSFKEIAWKLFPNTKTVAFYSPLNQYIELSELDNKSFMKMIQDPLSSENYKNMSIYVHELRHWIDNVSTLWGLENLISMHEALDARYSQNPENFHKVLSLHRNYNRDDLNDYYTEVMDPSYEYKSIDDVLNYRFTCGYRFDENGKMQPNLPIVFTRFQNKKSGKDICRIPFSVSSLLETNAMYEEIYFTAGYLNGTDSEDKIVDEQLFKNAIIKQLYTPDLMLYNVAVHAVSNVLNITDTIEAYQISSQLSNFVLNLPEEVILELPNNLKFVDEERGENLIRSKDKGAIFLNLLFGVKDFCGGQLPEDSKFKELLFQSNNLPKEEELFKMVKNSISNLQYQITDARILNRLEHYLKNGLNLFEKRGLFSDEYIIVTFLGEEKSLFPDIVLNDSVIDWSNLRFRENFEAWFDFTYDMQGRFDEFVKICGI